jgi:hypothetical protein
MSSSLDDAMFGTAEGGIGPLCATDNSGFPNNTLPLACQLRAFDRLIDQAIEQRAYQYNDPGFRQRVKLEARKRLVQGFDTYGDQMWRYTRGQLEHEEIEEDADGAVYRTVILWQTT